MSHPDLVAFAADTLYKNHAVDDEYLNEQLAVVTGFWADGNLSGILKHGRETLAKEIYDIRLSSYYLYSLWASEKSCSLLDILQAVDKLLAQDESVWLPHSVTQPDSTPPDNDKPTDADKLSATEQLLQTCLGMLFKRIEQRLDRFTTLEDGLETQPCETIEYAEKLSGILSEKHNIPTVATSLNDIARYYIDACEEQQAEELEKAEQSSEEAQIDPADGNDSAIADNASDEEQNPALATLLGKATDSTSTDTIASTDNGQKTYSSALNSLLAKVQVFETLIQQEEHYKAAIVFEDIQHEVENFNPVRYLPELFSRYAGIRALFATELNQLLQQRETVRWQALQDYFIADPQGFVQMTLPLEEPDIESDEAFEDSQRYAEDDMDFEAGHSDHYQAQRNIDRSRLFEDD